MDRSIDLPVPISPAQDRSVIEPHNVDNRAGGSALEVGGTGSALEYVHRTPQPGEDELRISFSPR